MTLGDAVTGQDDSIVVVVVVVVMICRNRTQSHVCNSAAISLLVQNPVPTTRVLP